MEREKLGSRLGFLLLSAGCAIGIGNVWRFPYITGVYGGGAFVLFYLFFLVIMGMPVMSMEFAVGRASKKSIAKSYVALECLKAILRAKQQKKYLPFSAICFLSRALWLSG